MLWTMKFVFITSLTLARLRYRTRLTEIKYTKSDMMAFSNFYNHFLLLIISVLLHLNFFPVLFFHGLDDSKKLSTYVEFFFFKNCFKSSRK